MLRFGQIIGNSGALLCTWRHFPATMTALESIDIIRDSGMRSGLRLLLLSTLVVLVSACASNKQEEVLPEKTYYENAREAMTSGNFNEAEQLSLIHI